MPRKNANARSTLDAIAQRRRIIRHNSFRGMTASMKGMCRTMLAADSLTPAARTAVNILVLEIETLTIALKERKDP